MEDLETAGQYFKYLLHSFTAILQLDEQVGTLNLVEIIQLCFDNGLNI